MYVCILRKNSQQLWINVYVTTKNVQQLIDILSYSKRNKLFSNNKMLNIENKII